MMTQEDSGKYWIKRSYRIFSPLLYQLSYLAPRRKVNYGGSGCGRQAEIEHYFGLSTRRRRIPICHWGARRGVVLSDERDQGEPWNV